MAGSATHARLLLERVLGTPVSSRTVVLPELRDALTDEAARGAIIKAVGSGEVDIETGALLSRLASGGAEVLDFSDYNPSESFL